MKTLFDDQSYDEIDELDEVDVDRELVGSIYGVPDRWWGFDVVGRDKHPGACVNRIAASEKVQLLKGTDPKSARYQVSQVLVEPDETNHLSKATSFAIRPFVFSARRVAQLHFNRLIGALRHDDLQRMREELARLFAYPGNSAT
jgi:hypothetical protein